MATRPDIKIETPRLTLREMTEADAAELCRIVTIPAVGRMLFLFPPDWTVSAARDFIATTRFAGEATGRLAIADPTGAFIGSIGCSDRGRAVEIFYFLAPEVAGRGLITEAIAAFLEWIASEFGPRVIEARVFQDNPASARVLEKLGFVRVGEVMGTSAARLEPFPDWIYRLPSETRMGAEG